MLMKLRNFSGVCDRKHTHYYLFVVNFQHTECHLQGKEPKVNDHSLETVIFEKKEVSNRGTI